MFHNKLIISSICILLLVQVNLSGSSTVYRNNNVNKNTISNNTSYSSHDRILINNETDLINQVKINNWKGDGSHLNPYIIENYNISKSGGSIYPIGISIFNTTSFVLIQNCFINFEGKLSDRVGIYIGDSKNIDIKENVILLNRFGIELENTLNVNVTSNKLNSNGSGVAIGRGTDKTVINNNFFDQVRDGIWFSNMASNTNIIHNNFKSYNYTGIQISFPQSVVLIKDNVFGNTSNPISMNYPHSVLITNNIGYPTKSSTVPPLLIALVTIVFATAYFGLLKKKEFF